MEFLSSQTKDVIDFIKATYGDEPENLFTDSDTAVFRKGEKKKWYARLRRNLLQNRAEL